MNYLEKLTRIAVVDDDPQNRAAARTALATLAPSATVIEFGSAADILALLKNSAGFVPLLDFIFTGMQLEEADSGWDVTVAGSAWQIPVAVLSSEHCGHHGKFVLLGYPNAVVYGTKHDPAVWHQVITSAFSGDDRSNALLMSLKFGKHETPDFSFGEVVTIALAGSVLLMERERDVTPA